MKNLYSVIGVFVYYWCFYYWHNCKDATHREQRGARIAYESTSSNNSSNMQE
jgi:hypothetical protein